MGPELLPGEREEASLRPHPLGWLGPYTLGALPLLWGIAIAWVFRTDWWQQETDPAWWQFWQYLYGNDWSGYVLAVVGIGIIGAAIAVVTIRWRVFFAYVGAALVSVAVAITNAKQAPYETMLPVLLGVAGLIGIGIQEAVRRGHRYRITNLRIVFQGGTLVRRERQIRFESITDLDIAQGPLGRAMGYGTIIPVTQSGFGLGEDQSNAGMAVGGGGKKGGVGIGAAVMAGGGRSVQTGRARTFHQLTAVRPFDDIKGLVERLVQEATSTPYLREQVDLQRKMADALERLEARDAPEAGP